MTTKIEKVTCDVCGREIEHDIAWSEGAHKFRIKVKRGVLTMLQGFVWLDCDICSDCRMSFYSLYEKLKKEKDGAE